MNKRERTKFNRVIAGLLVSTAVLNAASAAAETDMTKVTCGDFTQVVQSKDHEQEVAGALFMGFLWGLYKGKDDPAIIGTRSDNQKLGKLAQYCTANPNVDVITATDKLWTND